MNRPVNKLLATLPMQEYERVESLLTVVTLRFRQILYKQTEIIQHVFFPGGGACSLTKVMGDGNVAEIATIGKEGVIGAAVFFGEDQSFGETIVQVADGGGFCMPVDAFVTEMARRGAFYNRIIRYSQALMSQVMQTTVCNGLHSVEQRCCRWLLMTYDRVGSDNLPLTHELIAMMLAVPANCHADHGRFTEGRHRREPARHHSHHGSVCARRRVVRVLRSH